jgi:hypothetical protein
MALPAQNLKGAKTKKLGFSGKSNIGPQIRLRLKVLQLKLSGAWSLGETSPMVAMQPFYACMRGPADLSGFGHPNAVQCSGQVAGKLRVLPRAQLPSGRPRR